MSFNQILKTKPQRIKEFISRYWPGFVFFGSFGTFAIGTFYFKILENFLENFLLYVSLPLFIFGVGLAFYSEFNKPEEGQNVYALLLGATLISVFFTLLATFFLLGVWQIANGLLDDSELQTHIVEVERKGCEEGDCTVVFESWNFPDMKRSLSIPTSIYNKIRSHREELVITTKAGNFGFEWIVDIENVK